jgi:hypothetical protein
MSNTAWEYAEVIREELELVAEVDRYVNRYNKSSNWPNRVRDWLDEQGIKYGPRHTENIPDIGIHYLNDALDVWVEMEYRPDRGLDAGSVRLLRTCGGPHCEIIYDGDDELRIETAWGSEQSVRTVECPPVANALSLFLESAVLSNR